MAKYDSISSLFLAGLGLGICVESIRVNTGSLSNPGPGLFPLGCGLTLGILSLVALARSYKSQLEEVGLEKARIRKKVILTLASMLCYPFMMALLGFHIVTILWMFFVCWFIGRVGWKISILISVVTTFSCYYLFAQFLIVRFPRGVLGF